MPSKSKAKTPASGKKLATTKRRLWLLFTAEATTEPLIWEMSKRFDLKFNIRNSSVTDNVGIIALELEGDPKVIEQAISWYRKKGVKVDPVELSAIEG
ncbi:MAG TPA: NIL domain-containing protein [Candidatus Limnocylindria bacterium]|jgi:ABC-type methionine transport system ATPase subunit|nr:NIL domain-containing protein [Candidatus Limnocylindria bacterium]